MADTKISALPAATTPLAGTEVLPIVQSGVTKQVSVTNAFVPRATQAYTVGTGGDFNTVTEAISFLNSQVLLYPYFTTLTVLDGTIPEPGTISIQTPFGRQIKIVGQNTYSKTLSSVQSSSGSAGAWSIVLNVNSVTSIAVNDYAVFSGLSGGTNPTYLAGVWKVTNVDAVNTRITISSTHKNATAPSGNVAGTVTILKSVLTFTGCDGFDVWGGGVGINLDKIVIVGDGTGSYAGIANDDCDRVYVATVLGVTGFGGVGVQSLKAAEINTDGMIVSSGNGGHGFRVAVGGSIDGTLISSGNAQDGISAQIGGIVNPTTSSVSSGNTNNGWHATLGGVVNSASTTATGNGSWGYLAESQGFVDATSVTTANNTTGASSVGVVAVSASLGGGVFAVGTTGNLTVGNANFSASTTGGPYIRFAAASSTFPTLVPNNSSTNTGFGAQAAGNISVIVGGAEQARWIGAGGLQMIKGTDPASAPGAGFAKMYWVAGTNAGTAKLIAYAGTSTTPTTIIDNVGGGF